jgi:DNA ligase 1
MQFKIVAQVFESLETVASRIAMTQQLAQLLQQVSPKEASLLCYLGLGELNPPHIGTQFNIAQKNMAKIVAHVTDKSELVIQEELIRLGDLGSVIAHFYKACESSMTLQDVYQVLVSIEKISGVGSQEQKSREIESLIMQLDSISAKYVIRIILGTLRLGFSDMTLIDALSWMQEGNKSLSDVLQDAYNVCADIGLIAYTLKHHGIDGIKKMTIKVGVPIRPAAAERLPDVQSIIAKLGQCVAQPKLDGFRLQVHVDKTGDQPIIRFFSRNLTDMSDMFPEFVTACMQLPVKNFIADGEAMVYDPNTKMFALFQETVKRRRKHGIEQMASELPLQLYLFDLLYLDEKSLLDVGHQERRQVLINLLQNNTNQTLQLIDECNISTAHQLESYFIESIAAGLEGLVIKKIDAHYQPGKRSSHWIKLKYQATDKLLDSLDVVILGYYAGQGKRAQFGIGAILVGIYNPRDNMYETIAKIGTGFTDQEWIDLKRRCDGLKVLNQPSNVWCDRNLTPSAWVAPSQVCEVLADEITYSPIHTAGKSEQQLGLALRFPRFLKYRDDKNADQATTLVELETLKKRL